MPTVSVESLEADRLEALAKNLLEEVARFRTATALPKAAATRTKSLLNLEAIIEQSRKSVAKFDEAVAQIFADMRAVANGSAVQTVGFDGKPGLVRNEDDAAAKIMQLAEDAKTNLLAAARARLQLQSLEERLAQSAPPPPAYLPSSEGEPSAD